ncbi:MAG: Kazal-type serine protease inhibitor domain-containing protein, partial [Candidatus Magasanikbacteria bacterium]
AVCSVNGYTYESECMAQEEGVDYTMGACEETNTTTGSSSCSTQEDVCGFDGNIYDNRCIAEEKGVSIDSTWAACESTTDSSSDTTTTDSFGSTTTCSETQQVCSAYGYTYESECMAQEEGIEEYTMGPCEESTTGTTTEEDTTSESSGPYCVKIPSRDDVEAKTRELAESYQTDYPDSEIVQGECVQEGPFCVYTESGNEEFSVRSEAEAYAEENAGEVSTEECPEETNQSCSEKKQVCSVNGYTYESECMAQEEGIEEYTMGPCEESTTGTTTEEDTTSESSGPYCVKIPSRDDVEAKTRELAESYQTDYPDSEIVQGECSETTRDSTTEGPFCVVPEDESMNKRPFDTISGAKEYARSLDTDNISSEIEDRACSEVDREEKERQCPAFEDRPTVEEVSSDVEADSIIEMEGVQFQSQAEISAGSVVRFINSDSVEHTVTIERAGVDISLNGGESVKLRFNRAGSYRVVCTIHEDMETEVEVEGGACPDRKRESASFEGPFCVIPEDESVNKKTFDTKRGAKEYARELETDNISSEIEDKSCSEVSREEQTETGTLDLEFGINPKEITVGLGQPASYNVRLFSDISKPVFLYAESQEKQVKIAPKSIMFTPQQKEKRVRVILPGKNRKANRDVISFSAKGTQLNQKVRVNISSGAPGKSEDRARDEDSKEQEREETRSEEENPGTTEEETTGSCPLEEGEPYTHLDTSSVWLITEDCTKRPFQSKRIFNTYFDSFASINSVAESKLNQVLDDSAGFVPYGPKSKEMGLFKGGSLVKIPSDNRVYLLLGNKKYWITEEKVFNELNYKWNWIQDVAPSLLDRYESAGKIDYTDHHPVGTLIKYPDSNKVYRIDKGAFGNLVKRHIKNEKVFEALGFRFDRIVTVDPSEEYETGKPITMNNFPDDIFNKQGTSP